MELHP